MEIKQIPLTLLHNNTGQIKDLPSNPRYIREDQYKKLLTSIKDDPEMLNLREILAYDNFGELVVIAGNMRLRACIEAGMTEVPVKILPSNTPVDKLKRYVIKDNIPYGENDWDKLANEWEQEKLEEWGLETEFNKDKQTPSGAEFEPLYKIEIDCKNEANQQKIYNELTELGYICKTSTL